MHSGSRNNSSFGVPALSHGREGRDGEIGAVGTGINETSGESEDGADPEGGVESGGYGGYFGGGADECLVAGFDGYDFGGDSEDSGCFDEGCGAEVAEALLVSCKRSGLGVRTLRHQRSR